MFFKSVPLDISPELQEEATKLLSPVSRLTPLSDASKADGFISIQGEVVEISTIKKVQVGKDAVPLRSVSVKQDQTQITLSLCREAAILPFQVGAQTRLTHLKGNNSSYGFRLQSTAYTVSEDTTETLTVSALGAMEIDARPGVLHLLVEGDKLYETEECLWATLQEVMKKLSFYIKVSLTGNRVIAAEVLGEEETAVVPL
ncbi:hypothetical protein L3Q82_015679 [Scortum barcoo]|uniref:Uncharacterized protein n=1 Tax=Scortum barcoo TaxID=214431 RepID=A0ACB8VNG0_9TELE|nr:hypothetical protein L3Q82_015679 [Scortum barcoo]